MFSGVRRCLEKKKMIRRMVAREGWYADVPAEEWMEDPELADDGATVVMRDGVVLCHEEDGTMIVSCGGLLARVPPGTNPARIVWRRRRA